MGKSKKAQRQQQPRFHEELPSAAFDGEEDACADRGQNTLKEEAIPTAVGERHALYQKSVQSPKGDISYLQKFFLEYIGRRSPFRLREDFCGTALICAEWVKSDARRTALGLDLDEDALTWGLRHNMSKIGSDAQSRVYLFHGNVLEPLSMETMVKKLACANVEGEVTAKETTEHCEGQSLVSGMSNLGDHILDGSNVSLPDLLVQGADIVCAFNYSCCCLHKRVDLISYFKQTRKNLSNEGGIFVLDLYGGASSECALKLRRRFDDFTYTWEQEGFDVLTRTTRISLHFQPKNQRVLRHAFSYSWRLWTLPEVRDCLDEAGYNSTHVWVREMPELQGRDEDVEDDAGTYEEVSSFQQCDAWNAYIVAVSKAQQRK